MLSFHLPLIIKGVLWPAAICGGFYILSAFLPSSLRYILRASSVGIAVAASYFFLIGLPTWPWLGAPAGLLLIILFFPLIASLNHFSEQRQGIVRLLAIGITMLLVLWPLVMSLWSRDQIIQVFSVIGFGSVFLLWMADVGSEQMKPPAVLMVLIMVATGEAGAFALDGSASLSQLAGALAAALGTAMALSMINIFKPSFEFNLTSLLILIALALCHFCYGDSRWQEFWWLPLPLAFFMIRSAIPLIFAQALNDVIFTALVAGAPIGWGLFQMAREAKLI